MQWANAEELITGTTATTLSPQRTVSRAQLATILQRFAPMVSYQQRETDAPKPPQTHSYTRTVRAARLRWDTLPPYWMHPRTQPRSLR